jgi:signal transduction histidine kinase
MFNKITESLTSFLIKAANKNKRIQVAIFLGIVSPVILIAAFAYNSTYQDLTESALARRKSIASLASTALEQRFNRLTDVGVSLATRVRFRQLVSEEKWDEAIEILKGVREDFPFIDRVFLADPTGTLMADTPALPEVRGKNFSSRDWYRGVSHNWKPYVSDVYQRAAAPRHNVVAAAIPVKAEQERIIGILVLQVQLNALVDWSNSIDIGPSGFVYVVDRKGQLATHPGLPSSGEILNYSSVPVVQKVLRQQSGIEIMFNPIERDERVAAYAPIPGIGWGVIATESTQTAFAQRNEHLNQLLVRYGVIFLISSVLAYIILRTVIGLKQAEERIETLNHELQQRAIRLELANKELESFSYSVSHDLRAPLRSIDGFSEALAEDYADKLDAEAKDFLQRIRAGTQRMGQLIDDLLNLSRVARSEIKADQVDLSTLAHIIATELRKTNPGREVEFLVDKGITAIGDRRLLRIALENLIGNAWKFTAKRPSARIEFGVNGDNGLRTYFVRDNGAGFDMEYANKLFGAFQRLHKTTEFNGTGIGLATVQRIIHRHSGCIWAEAKVEQGATFYFTLGNDASAVGL